MARSDKIVMIWMGIEKRAIVRVKGDDYTRRMV